MGTTENTRRITYQFEYEERLRCAFIGAGGHSYRNIYPAFQYAPVELRAVCDLDAGRAAAYAGIFGAARHYSDHRVMLEREKPTAVFIVTSYDADGRVQALDLALDCLAAGAHVWMEKPTASSTAEVAKLAEAARLADRIVVTGTKTVFSPVMRKVKAIVSSPEFGEPSSIFIRYPLSMPSFERRASLVEMNWFLDCIFHPAAVLFHLMGSIDRISHEWEAKTGASVTAIRFQSGAVGALHLAAGASPGSPVDRTEVIGNNANVVIENGTTLTYYRPTPARESGRVGSFLTPTESAPLRWEPEYTYGQLYNKNLFYLGYVDEIVYFCDCIMSGTAPDRGSLTQAFRILELFEAYRRAEPGTWTTVDAK
ncbi:Gfo/Idh/MocA family protein [Streptomyces ureilyticus]|uniref:Gfo/Idh/MocA family oxidoreductase n=1 Tax=Streptomyces ureilyticus TaxID=1775131 RepID=A0ABX0DHZ6_9ACTN|nr:Gfo/Idh/MocA family oxidoreductase [Streptomyces ureilyticus]NGO41433.1 Gfo/Idh/MocA family oxidoreductase [Streptomyces ureilyticus]